MSFSKRINPQVRAQFAAELSPAALDLITGFIDDAERTGRASGMIEAVGALAPFLSEGGATAALRVTNEAMQMVASPAQATEGARPS